MKENSRNIMVGLFVGLGLILLAVLIVLFGEAPRSVERAYRIVMRFPSAGPVNKGDPVLVNGVEVGYVDDIVIDPNDPRVGVRMVTRINYEYRIPVDAEPLIREQTMALGRAAVRMEVTPEYHSDQMLPRDGSAELEGTVAGGIEELIPSETIETLNRAGAALADLAEELTPVAADLHMLFEQRPVAMVDSTTRPADYVANISTVVQRFDEAIININTILGNRENQENLRAALANLREASGRVNEFLGTTNQENLSESLANLRIASERFREFAGNTDDQVSRIARSIIDSTDRLDTVLDNLAVATGDMAAGRGSVGRMLKDDELYESLVLSSRQLTTAIEQLHLLLQQWRERGLKLEGGLLQ